MLSFRRLKTNPNLITWLWDVLTAPFESIQSGSKRRDVRVLSAIHLTVLMGASAILLYRWIAYQMTITLQVGGITVLMLGFAYLLSRTRYYQIASFILVVTTSLAIVVGAALNTESNTIPIIYLSFSSFIALAILPMLAAALVPIVNVGAVLVTLMLFPELQSTVSIDDLVFVVLISVAAWVIMGLRYYDLMLIKERTEEAMRSEKQRMSLQLEQQRAQLLRDFINDISHDIRSPLSTIKLNLYLLRHKSLPDQEQNLNILEQQADYLNRLVESLLTMASLDDQEDMTFQPISLNRLVEVVAQRAQPKFVTKNQTCELNLYEELPKINGEAFNLQRCLTNLITNAFTYTPEGGLITVRTGIEGYHGVCTISDTGMGIAPDDLTHIFDRFYRTIEARETAPSGGTGLGLSIVKRIVDMHNGKIEVESIVGKGTTFRIYIPLAKMPEGDSVDDLDAPTWLNPNAHSTQTLH